MSRKRQKEIISDGGCGCKTISIVEALRFAHKNGKMVSQATLIKWVYENNLGHQPGGLGGKWYVFEQKFNDFILGVAILNRKKGDLDGKNS